MRKIIILITLCILMLSGCGFGANRGVVPFSSEEVVGENYAKIVAELNELGFENIELVPLMDLKSENVSLNETISKVVIGKKNEYKAESKFDLSSMIKIEYHSYSQEPMNLLSADAKGMSYEDVKQHLDSLNFFDIKYVLLEDDGMDNIHDNEVEYITVGGRNDYALEEVHALDTEIVVYHSYIEETIPLTSELAKGMSYDEAMNVFSNTKFNVKTQLIQDMGMDNIYENEVEYIEINGSSEYTKDDCFPINSEIIIYHSYIADKMPISINDAKSMNYEAVLSLFSNTKFKDVKVKSNGEQETTDVNETYVEKITVNGKSDYSVEEMYPYNSEIVIYYSTKIYEVSILLECAENLLFSKYDVIVYVNDEKLGTLKHGAAQTFKTTLEKGEYELILKSADDSSITGIKTFNIKADRLLRYAVSCTSSAVKLSYYKQLHAPYTNKDITNANVDDVIESYKSAGFSDVTKKPLNDLDASNLSKSNMVSEIKIDNSTSFTKKDIYYKDSEVVIYYHSGKQIEVPITYYDAEDKNYQEIVDKFVGVGFTNVKAEEYTGRYKDKARNNMVHSINVNGDTTAYSGDKVSLDAPIIVYYYAINYESYTVSKMMNDLETNAYNAKNVYTDKYISATGYVGSIDSSGKSIELVASNSGWDFVGITCEISSSDQKELIAKLTTGKKITVKGKITLVTDMGYFMDIHEIIIN